MNPAEDEAADWQQWHGREISIRMHHHITGLYHGG
jgi:hypothetical protein